jgi:hypothetical protein
MLVYLKVGASRHGTCYAESRLKMLSDSLGGLANGCQLHERKRDPCPDMGYFCKGHVLMAADMGGFCYEEMSEPQNRHLMSDLSTEYYQGD